MLEKPGKEHRWLHRLVGEWDYVHKCRSGNSEQISTATGRAIGRSIGGLWVVLESTGAFSGNQPFHSQMMLGFNHRTRHFEGTFIASMMTHLWIYRGQQSDDGHRLSLYVEGPAMEGSGMASYCDTIELIDEDHWVLRSELQLPDGQWSSFMEGHHHRVGSQGE